MWKSSPAQALGSLPDRSRKVARIEKRSPTAQHQQRRGKPPQYQPLNPPLVNVGITSVPLSPAALSECEPSVLLLLAYGHRMGLHFWQDVSDPQRIMFDATEFNRLGGYTSSKGIKGDFLARMKRHVTEDGMPSRIGSVEPRTSRCLRARA
jgi:hypothetical protein